MIHALSRELGTRSLLSTRLWQPNDRITRQFLPIGTLSNEKWASFSCYIFIEYSTTVVCLWIAHLSPNQFRFGLWRSYESCLSLYVRHNVCTAILLRQQYYYKSCCFWRDDMSIFSASSDTYWLAPFSSIVQSGFIAQDMATQISVLNTWVPFCFHN